MANLPVPIPRTASVSEIETGAYGNSVRDALNFLLNPPLLRVNQATIQTLTTAVWTSISQDGSTFDPYGMHSNTTNNTRATAIVSGWYLPSGGVAFAAGATGTRGARFAVNGTAVPGTAQFGPPTASGSLAIAAISLPVFLSAGDYLEIQGVQNSGANLSTLVATDLDSTLALVRIHS
jgi:hypothetical protein